MGMTVRRRTRVVWALLVLTATVAAIDGAQLWWQLRWNALIVANRLPAEGDDLPPQVRFAQAHALAATGASEAALQRYRSLQDDTPLGQAARFNGANLLLRQALVVRAGSAPGQAIALIELAKEGYRDVLRADPQHWPARYNLERAQRLLPDPDELLEPAPPESKHDAERAATTMRGYSPGLP
jgi:mxaK protein